jgi:hypothetical protein
MLGIGAVGIAGAIYFLTRKKKKGLSGISPRVRAHPRGRPRPKRRTGSKRIKPMKLV